MHIHASCHFKIQFCQKKACACILDPNPIVVAMDQTASARWCKSVKPQLVAFDKRGFYVDQNNKSSKACGWWFRWGLVYVVHTLA